MSLTAREWLLLPKEEQEKRKDELSAHECFLYTLLFTQKKNWKKRDRKQIQYFKK